MSDTKEYFMAQRERQNKDDMADADYLYEQFLKEQYPQHINNLTITTNDNTSK